MILSTPHMTSIKVRKDLNVSLNNTTLESVQFTKFLGGLIDECLTWKQHIDYVSKTVSRNIDAMNKLNYSIPGRILYTLYCTLITPYPSYHGIRIWGSTCKSYLDKLIKLQKWVVRTITNSHYRSHTRPLFAKNNLLNVSDMYTLELGVFMYKYSINDLPVAFKEHFMSTSCPVLSCPESCLVYIVVMSNCFFSFYMSFGLVIFVQGVDYYKEVNKNSLLGPKIQENS